MGTLLDENKESIVAYYILPLVDMSFKAFNSFYVNCKLSRNHKEVIVYLIPLCPEEFWKNESYKLDYTSNLTTYAVFTIPEEFSSDVKLFVEGKYSKMSSKAKDKIYKHSGLHFNKKMGEIVVTDMKLIALTKHKALRSYLIDNQMLLLCDNGEFIKLKNKDIIYHE